MKKFFKYTFIGIGTVVLLVILGIIVWWNIKNDKEKSDFFMQINDFESAVRYDQENSKIWMERSVAFNKAGDFQKGFDYLNKAVELNPKMHLGYRGWIRLRKLRDYDKALMDFERLDSLTPNFTDAPWGEDIDFLRGECYYGKKDYEKAKDMFRRSIENQGEDWADIQTFVYLGLCEFELGNYERSISEFQRALKQSNTVCEAHFGLAKAYQKTEETEKAKESIQSAEDNIVYKRDDVYNEFLNEIYLSEILEFKKRIK
ncbi:tetratricopeptide repeat protein [Sinomicrobium kalidii]|uniref:tetratricopeptide repeat protein n=1 Tax=Sinomicrobium kalidii TaxID=2900738 RepID=UPI001E2EAFDA|nr:tetratricopeptide repeat protein [Sinomicrobium kalidii]UGU17270.1 tetratricopeptide repeat protein [Sinomicrobium kalidii]